MGLYPATCLLHFVYHLQILLNNRTYPNFQSHRADSVAQEFRTYLRRVLLHPLEIIKRYITTRRIIHSGQAYHLALLRSAHAANPDAVLIYKPHPDVEVGLRPGSLSEARQWCDVIAINHGPISLIN